MDAGLYGKDYTYREITEVDQTTQITGLEYVGLPEDLEFGYTYNNLGYIATYAAPGEQTITYTYDNLGQLLSAVGDSTYTYTYDSAGNILTANGHTYTYGDADWKDLLTAFDNQAITYDAIGNPLSYYNGTRWTFTWENGRSLATATNGVVNISYDYDMNGLRTSKTVGNTVHDYYYAGGRLLREVITTTAEDETVTTSTLDFFYDASGQPYVLKYNGVEYYYITNLQGDVVSIVDPTTGAPVATYEYDPFGKVISATGDLAVINPLRYRGYYYDSELGMYYLQSRYYDPAICRFINADALVSTGQSVLGFNMFAYCNNSPVNCADTAGSISYICLGDNHHLFTPMMLAGCGGGGGGYSVALCGATISSNGSNRKTKKSLADIFGAGVTQSNSYDAFSVDTLFGGAEMGFSTSKTLSGDVSKPVSVYAQNASNWWKFTEYKVGAQFNIGDGGYSIAYAVGEVSSSFSCGNGTTIEFMFGLNKIGCTISYDADFGSHTAGEYAHVYIRTLPTAALFAVLVYAQEYIPDLGSSLAPYVT